MLSVRWNKFLLNPLTHIAVLLAVCSILYGPILHAPFQFDDFGILMRNPNIESLPHFFKNWQNLERKALTFLTFAINYRIGGQDTFGYHAVNVALHFFTACFLYFIIRNLLRTPSLIDTPFAKEKELFALFVSLVFLTHPLQTQSVTYIWQRSELLSGFFYLLAYGLYLKGRLQGKAAYYLGATAAFYIGFFAKGTVVSLPILVLLTEFYFFATARGRKIIGIISLSVAAVFIVSLFFTHPFRILFETFHLGFLVRNWQEMSWDYLWTQFKVLLVYIRLAFLPVHQSVDYYFPIVRPYPDVKVVLSFLVLAGLLYAACRLYKRERLMSFGIFWFFIYLLPTSFSYLLVDLIFEHRVYISMAGFGLFIGAVLFRSIKNVRWRNAIMALIIVALSVLTVLRNNLWCSPVALMEDAIEKNPLNFRPYLNLGTYFYRLGNSERAAYYYEKALALKPYSAELYNNLGLIYRDQGDRQKAEGFFEKALSMKPDFVLSMINLAYLDMDRMQLKGAEEQLNRALKIERSDKVYTALGYLYFFRRDLESAKTYFLKALAYNPNNSKASMGLGNLYFTQRDYPEAVAAYQAVLALDPFSPEARLNLMRVYRDMGDSENYRRLSVELRKSP